MRKSAIVLSCIACTALVAGGAWASADAFKSDTEKNSYAIGVNMINQLKARKSSYDLKAIAQGVRDAAAGTPKLSAAETEAAVKKLQEEAEKTARIEFEKKAAENKKRSDAFLAQYAKKEGVQKLPSGVMYRVLKQGTGEMPSPEDHVNCKYRGTLADGTQFDATAPDKPVYLRMKKMVPGLKEALTRMPTGSKWEIVIPPNEAFGEQGTKVVGPNEVVIFELELLDSE